MASLHGAACRDKSLADHLSAEHPLPSALGALAPEKVLLQGLKIEDRQKIGNGLGHRFGTLQVAPSIGESAEDVKLDAEGLIADIPYGALDKRDEPAEET
ncbi:hypothetical protein MAE02_55860 [Microvirga aerophila]|uniref:Uncharacterized protein n=1 Tax=Microvirga aerophila TaxID=670291 RepID=A0A512C0Z9_9HYPH|nr:hypothetical protein MAE02_55860 [Microvirga aerophila]